VARIEVRNHSDRPVRVASLGFDVKGDLATAVMLTEQEPGMTVPGVVAPHDSGFARFPKDKLESYRMRWILSSRWPGGQSCQL